MEQHVIEFLGGSLAVSPPNGRYKEGRAGVGAPLKNFDFFFSFF
jgi:hypothetical protein